MINAPETSSTRPYLIRAIHEWCIDNGFTPYLVVSVNETTQVPREFVKDAEIVLNASYDATSGLQLGNDYIEFKARFGGVAREIMVPVGRVVAIYARENGQGMAFPPPVDNIEGELPASLVPAPMDGSESDKPGASSAPERAAPQLVSVDGVAPAVKDVPDEDPPPKPPAGGGARPSLKLVK